jgi:purine nucleoside phosphorylase
MVSNLAAGHSQTPLTHAEVTETAARAGAGLADLLDALVQRWG